MRKVSGDEACVVFLIICALIIGFVTTYNVGWNRGYRASLVDAKKGLPPKWVITQRDDGTSGWEKNSTKEIK